MTDRRKIRKFINYLENECDWVVYPRMKKCETCGHVAALGHAKYCPMCGNETKALKSDECTENEVRDAIKHAGLK